MAHELDFSRGIAAIARAAGSEVPWHGYGFEVDPKASPQKWAVAASLDWTYEKAPVTFKVPREGNPHTPYELNEVPNRFAIYRSDTGAGLSVVTHKFKLVQPIQILDFYRSLIELGDFKMETCGALRGGQKVWALARSTKAEHEVKGRKDMLRGYLLLSTSCLPGTPTVVAFTSVRVVCANTLAMADYNITKAEAGEEGKKSKVKVYHNQTFNANDVKKDMGLMGESWKKFVKEVDALAKVKLSDKDAISYFAGVMKKDAGKVQKINKEGEQAFVDRRVKKLFEIYQDSPGAALGSSKGTLWGALNSVTFWTDHIRGRGGDVRADKALFGTGARTKALALKNAMALLG